MMAIGPYTLPWRHHAEASGANHDFNPRVVRTRPLTTSLDGHQHSGAIFLMKLQYHIPQTDLNRRVWEFPKIMGLNIDSNSSRALNNKDTHQKDG